MTRRERPGGGLFPPWLLYLAGAGMSSVAAAKRTVWGGPPFGAAEEQIANEYFELGRTRRLKKKNRKRERRR